MNDSGKIIGFILLGVFGVILLAGLFFGLSAVGRLYGVWSEGKAGQAELARAEQNRQIAIKEAMAREDSAKHLKQAEIIRAEGVAKANEIISGSLKENEAYLRYLWITDVAGKDIDKTVVYVPTEANIPILEAGRHK